MQTFESAPSTELIHEGENLLVRAEDAQYETHTTALVIVWLLMFPDAIQSTYMTSGTAHLNQWLQLQHNQPCLFSPSLIYDVHGPITKKDIMMYVVLVAGGWLLQPHLALMN